MRKVFEVAANDNQSDDFVLFADLSRDRSGQIIDEQIDFVNQNKGKRRVDGGDGIAEQSRQILKRNQAEMHQHNQQNMNDETDNSDKNDNLFALVLRFFGKQPGINPAV